MYICLCYTLKTVVNFSFPFAAYRLLWLVATPKPQNRSTLQVCNHYIRWFDTNLLVSARPHKIAVLNYSDKN